MFQKMLHPGKLTWNLKITCLKREIIFQNSTFGFHVNFQGCTPPNITIEPEIFMKNPSSESPFPGAHFQVNQPWNFRGGVLSFEVTTWMFPKIVGFPPKSSILIGFCIINHAFWGTPIFGNTHIHHWSNPFLSTNFRNSYIQQKARGSTWDLKKTL